MPQTLGYKRRVSQLIQILSKWSKKPSLDDDLSAILNEYYSIVNNGGLNFAETAIIVQSYSWIYEKRIDLLFKYLFELSVRLCSALSRPEEKQEQQTPENPRIEQPGVPETCVEPLQNASPPQLPQPVEPKNLQNEEKPPEKTKRKRRNKKEEEKSKKLTIPGLPNEILESLNLTECSRQDVIKECLSKLTINHPLYSVFAEIGDEISRTKNFITYNDLSLSGKSWNILYMLENLLNKNNPISEENNPEINSTIENSLNAVESTPRSNIESQVFDSGIELTQNSENNPTDLSVINATSEDNNDNIDNIDTSGAVEIISEELAPDVSENPPEIVENKVKDTTVDTSTVQQDILPELHSNLSKTSVLDEELRKVIASRNKIDVKDIKINLLRLPHNVLYRIDYFRLTSDYFTKERKDKVEKKIKNLTENPGALTRKRQRQMEKECIRLVKKLKTYDLDTFEKFCHSYNVSQGLCSPIPEKIHYDRKSVDNRSEMSYGYPVTPESGRFSISFLDSEFEQMDFDMDHDTDIRRTLSRADSGCCLTSPVNESHVDSLHESQVDSGIESHFESGIDSHIDSHSGQETQVDSEMECHFENGIDSHLDSHLRQENHVDSGLAFSSEPTPAEEEDPTLQKLKAMFPNAFSDPQRAELLKNLIQPPQEQEETENYVDWRNFINRKTARETEFNIHEYGTNILNCFPTKTKNEVIEFQTVVKGKSIGDVARYFTSTLQLANSYNIEICDKRQGEVKAEGFELKFLSDERPLEEFEEFCVPSESQFLDNLPSTSFSHSTPHYQASASRPPLYTNKNIKRRRVEYNMYN